MCHGRIMVATSDFQSSSSLGQYSMRVDHGTGFLFLNISNIYG